MGIPSTEGRSIHGDLPWRDEQVYIGTTVEECTRERIEKVNPSNMILYGACME